MTCEEVMDYMQRHLDGDLNSEEQKRMHEHLEGCSDCADMMERLARIDQDLANLPKVVPAFSLVDAIMPRLQQIDAASGEATPTLEATSRAAKRSASRPWYARGGFVRYGGFAAAAAVLGVLVVNGLTDSFGDVATRSESSSAGSAEMGLMMSKEEASANMADSALKRDAAPEAPAAMEAAPAADTADPNASVSDAPDAAPEPTPRAEAGDAKTGGDVGVAEAPNSEPVPAGEPAPAESVHGMQGGGVVAADEAPAEALAPKNAGSEPAEARYGLTGDPVSEEDAKAVDQYGAPALLSDDGAYAASVQPTADGGLVVVVDRLDGDGDYVSAYTWASNGTKVELSGWKGTTIEYTVTSPGGVRTFAIDAATGTETEID
ncbi:zf-HC2 domain-containing protein [Paenibacillus sp.]|uniref:anti-sigma factor family protein n=1 Tax=Paenibacillus sp. TaxID=58172 RepID=UPI002D2ED41D|nr:zf-HC2 domain-containing protein [Paenibacillus sp.]HZG57370.1 zf-HC2 domain-containing protein [Paenibacillus sp.]